MKKIFLVLLFTNLTIYLTTLEDCCFISSQNYTYLILQDFNSFSELHFNNVKNFSLVGIYIKPNKKLILDESLNLTGVGYNSLIVTSEFRKFEIDVSNIKGISLNSNPFSRLIVRHKLNSNDQIIFFYTLDNLNFDFYIDNRLIDSQSCNQNLLNSIKENLFSKINFLYVYSSSVIYRQNTCPLFFHKSKLSYIYLSSTNSFIVKNMLTFSRMPLNNSIFNSKIGSLTVFLYYVNLDSSILNEHIFSESVFLLVNGILSKIEDDIFKSLKNLRFLQFSMSNIRNIFQKRNKWLNYLNFDVTNRIKFIDLNKKYSFADLFILNLKQTQPNVSFYTFPDEDLCYFMDFPHSQLVMPVIEPAVYLNSTCTYKFITQYSNKYIEEIIESLYFNVKNIELYDSYYYYEVLNTFARFDSIELDCLKYIASGRVLCNTKIIENKQKLKFDFHFYLFDWTVFTKLNRIILSLFLIPIFTIICLIISLFSVRTLSIKEIKQNKMYDYLLIHFYFLSIYLFLVFFKLLYVCIRDADYNDVHLGFAVCSHNFLTDSARLINIIFIRFLSKTSKTCSNIFYSYFTFTRYISITEKNNRGIRIFKKFSPLWNVLLVILVSLFVNLYTYFQFSKKLSRDFTSIYSEFIEKSYFIQNFYRLESNFNELNDYTQELESSHLIILKFLSIIKIVFSDMFFILANILIDSKLFWFIRQKKTTIIKLTKLNETKNFKTRRRQKESEKRIISMIILNSINWLVFRTPQIVISFYGFLFRYEDASGKHFPSLIAYKICRTKRFCNLLVDLATLLDLVSIIVEFLLFLIIDKNFKKGLKMAFKKR